MNIKLIAIVGAVGLSGIGIGLAAGSKPEQAAQRASTTTTAADPAAETTTTTVAPAPEPTTTTAVPAPPATSKATPTTTPPKPKPTTTAPPTTTPPTTAPPTTAAPTTTPTTQYVAPTTTTTQPSGPKTSFGNGTYQVGVDIQPGLYRTAGGSSCYWKKADASNGTIDNYIQDGPAVVIIEASVATFTSSRCGTWDQRVPPAPAASFGDGTFEVDVDIQPGTYAAPGAGSCYWAKRDAAFETIDNYIQDGPAVVTIDPSVRFFQSSRCGTWTKR